MKNSIIIKIITTMLLAIVLIASFIGWYVYDSQTNIIKELQTKQKAYIIKKLKYDEKKQIEEELAHLTSLTYAIKGSLSNALINADTQSAEETLKYVLKNNNIKAVKIFDTNEDEIFLAGFKRDGKMQFSNYLSVYFNTLKGIKVDLVDDDEVIGYFRLYYDNSIIKQNIKELKENELKIFNTQAKYINNKIDKKLKMQFFSAVIGIFIIIFIIVLLLTRFVNKPLLEFQRGLNSFFDYIKDSTKEIKKINIDTNDEFGQMTKSVNESIDISVILHKEIQERSELTSKLNRELEENEYELELLNQSLEVKIQDRTEDLEKSKKEIEEVHKHTKDSIEYASLIQGALIPQDGIMNSIFKDNFTTWTPKDTVGGDIWLFEKLRHKDECLLFFIDCTGHGVPGAFVTMIVKSIEREIVAKLKKHPELDISPAIIMGYFNKTMKTLLRQEDASSLSNAGFDGGIIYYNRRTQILKFAGAETPLFYIDENGEYQTIKGNRYSVGYKKCDMNYEYKETVLEVKEGMKFYCTTDGFLDQNGGEKDFPFGKKRFGNIIKENYKKDMKTQQSIFLDTMTKYEEIMKENFDRNDDMTIIAFEIDKKSNFVEDTLEEIVKYEGIMTQNVIAASMDNIEAKITDMGFMANISTITIEYCQNMMNYSKGIRQTDNNQIVPSGTIEVQYINNNYYEIIATNIISKEDKEKIEPKLIEIQSLDRAGIKKRYRELRKSGQNTHSKGGGIGMYEIAKVSDKIEYDFKAINNDKYYFTMRSIVKPKIKKNTVRD